MCESAIKKQRPLTDSLLQAAGAFFICTILGNIYKIYNTL